jgi:hypothetical protein
MASFGIALLLALAACVLVLATPFSSASAADTSCHRPSLGAGSSPSLPLADVDDGWSFRHLYKGITGRPRVIQLCVVVMILSLVILIKK